MTLLMFATIRESILFSVVGVLAMWGHGLLLPPIFLSWPLFVPSMSAHWKMMTGGASFFILKGALVIRTMCMGLVRSTNWQELTAFLVDCELLAAGVDIQGIASRISSELAMTLKEHFSGMQCRCRVDNLNAKDAEREGGKGMAALRLLGLYCLCSTGSYNCFGMLQEKSASIRA